jgi:translation initiation factor IF-3
VNERIRAREVRLIDDNGVQLGVMPSREALEIARQRDLDLIEVAPNSQPPVCRIMDYGKHKYEQAKRERETRRRQRATEVRRLQLKPQIGQHDLAIKLRKLRELLAEGSKVRVTLRFRGREMSRPELGFKLLERVTEELSDVAQAEGTPRREGRMMNLMFVPKPGTRAAQPAKPKEQKVSRHAKRQDREEQQVAEQPRPAEQVPEAQDTEDSGEAG